MNKNIHKVAYVYTAGLMYLRLMCVCGGPVPVWGVLCMKIMGALHKYTHTREYYLISGYTRQYLPRIKLYNTTHTTFTLQIYIMDYRGAT